MTRGVLIDKKTVIKIAEDIICYILFTSNTFRTDRRPVDHFAPDRLSG